MPDLTFRPTLLGTLLSFEDDDSEGMITDETPCEIFIESAFFTGWMSKASFWDLAGVD